MELFPNKLQRIRQLLLGAFPFLLIVLVAFLFVNTGNQTSESTLSKEQQFLEQALTRRAIQGYALTGRYPENLDTLLEDSGITYDPDTFLVEYVTNGSNLLPRISVIPISGTERRHSYDH